MKIQRPIKLPLYQHILMWALFFAFLTITHEANSAPYNHVSSEITRTVPLTYSSPQILSPLDDQAVRANGGTPVTVEVMSSEPYVLLVDDQLALESPAGTYAHIIYGIPRGTHTIAVRTQSGTHTIETHVLKVHGN
jgi:hypothetical protein